MRYRKWGGLTRQQQADLFGTNLPDEVGGRWADPTQAVGAARQRIKDAFPMNGVPQEVVDAPDEAYAAATTFERSWERLVDAAAGAYRNG